MEIGLSTACFFGSQATEDSARIISEAGFSLCEIFFDALCECEAAFYPILKKGLGETRVHSIHAMSSQFEPQLFSIGRRQREEARQIFFRVLEQGKRLGATCYVMHGSMLQGGIAKNIRYERIAPMIFEIADVCARFGLRLAFENVSWCIFSTPDFIEGMRAFGDHPNLYYTLDIKQAARLGLDPMDFARAMRGRIANVHLCDFTRDENGLSLAIPGKGSFDFKALFDELRGNGYEGPALVEVYSDSYMDEEELFSSARSLQAL